MKRTLSLFALLLVISGMTGCAPPPKSGSTAQYGQQLPQDGGKPILSINPKKHGPFRTVMVDGVEMMEARGAEGKFGGTFYESQIGDGPKTFNAYAAFDNTSTTLGGMFLSGLVTTDAYTGDVLPNLAKEVKLADDKLTYTVTLRKGLQWSDGKPITADDVVFTWNEIIKPGLGNPSSRDVVLVEGQFPEVKALDPLTIQFKTAKPFAPFMRNLGNSIYPAHIFKPVVAKGPEAFAAFWNAQDAMKNPGKFISNGMWILEKYEPRQRVSYKRNPKFFMIDRQGRRLPYLDRYVVSFVNDQNNEELQFEQGKVDSYGVPGNFLSHVRQLKKPAFKLYNLGPAPGTTFVALNLNNRKKPDGKPYVDPIKSEWFRDVNFRQAINHAINREDMVANILKGVGTPLFTSESPAAIFFNQKLAKGFSADPKAARQLLSKSGFTWDKQGKLHDKHGNLVRFTLLTNAGNTEREATGVNVKQDLADIGMTVDFKPVDFNVLIGNLNEGNWETMIMGLTGGDRLEPHSGANVWKSDGGLHLFNQRVVKPGKPVDLSDRLPWEKQLDDIFERGAQTFDTEQRRKIYAEYQQIIYDEAPLIYLYSPLSIMAVRERIQNFDPTPLATFHNLEEIWINDAAEK
jgi:peptide/nickel transport system substrate-binding protein